MMVNSRTTLGLKDEELFLHLFSAESLAEVFYEKFSTSSGKGIDRLNGFQFLARAREELQVASAKCISGTYRFAPYLEVLRLKGRGKAPRIIGVPTIRDRIVLFQLNKFLARQFPECVPSNLASTYVRNIADTLKSCVTSTTWICTTDIKTFYDSIQQSRLLTLLSKRIDYQPALALVKHALLTPTVPKNTRRNRHSEYRSEHGVPQGLAISNILASIYMAPVDDALSKMNVSYYRYVDDVLIFGGLNDVETAYDSLKEHLKRRGLEVHPLHSGKSQIDRYMQPFSYLGYVFQGNKITVRDSTVERFLQSIAAKFSDFAHNKSKRLEKFKYLNADRLREIFLLELNERITGAIKEKKRYGWIAYFSQITDLALLHKLDLAIQRMFYRLADFDKTPPAELRTLRRAYWEIKFNPQGGYVRDYDSIQSTSHKLQFLVERGRVDPEESLTNDQIDARYDKYVGHNLKTMLADEGALYG